MDAFRLDGKVALVTGAGGGLGRAQVKALIKAGATVVATDVTDAALETLSDLKLPGGASADAITIDVTDEESIHQAVTYCEAEYGRIDLLVNNAGISLPGPALDYDMALFERTCAINFRGVFAVSKAVSNSMVSKSINGAIANLASIGGMVVDGPNSAAYDGTKAAVIQITKNFAFELAPHGIRVNAVAPGYTHTPMIQKYLDDREYRDLLEKRLIPMGRVGRPEEIATAIVFLLSDAASYITGHTLNVDGGWVIQ